MEYPNKPKIASTQEIRFKMEATGVDLIGEVLHAVLLDNLSALTKYQAKAKEINAAIKGIMEADEKDFES